MAVETTTTITGPLPTNGTTTVFNFTFQAMSADEVDVFTVDASGNIASIAGFTATLADVGGYITCDTAPPSGLSLYIASNPDFRQQIAFERGSRWLPDPVNEGLDRSAARDLFLRSRLSLLSSAAMLIPALRAGKFLAWDGAGNPYPASGTGADGALRTDIAKTTGAQYVGFRGRTAFDKLNEVPSVEDAGAVGDGVTDDGDAINLALSTYQTVRFQPGKVYYTSKRLVVPTTCRRIYGQGALVKGPGSGGTVDGFHFENFNQGPNTFPTWHRSFVSRDYELPGLYDFRRAISILNAAFLPISSDIIGFCYDGIYIEATTGPYSWAVQNVIRADMVQQCENAIHLVTVGGSVEGIQGVDVHIPYSSGNGCGIRGTFDGVNANINFNIFRFGNLDGNGRVPLSAYAVNFSHELSTTINTFLFDNEPINMNPIGAASPYVKINQQEVVQSGRYLGNGFAPYNYGGFLPGGYRTTAAPGAGTMTIYVDQSVATTGIGSSASPYKTIAEAIDALQDMDGFGYTVVISMAAGTYSEAVLIDTRSAGSGNWRIIMQPTSGTVTLTGGITVTGPCYVILQNFTVTTKGITSSVNAYVGVNNITFGAATGQAHLVAAFGGALEIQANYSITGGAAVHVQADRGGRIVGASRTVTLTGTPAFSNVFALASMAGSLIDFGGSTFTGSATGVRYSATALGLINTNGGGASFLPGNSAGSTTGGGQYV